MNVELSAAKGGAANPVGRRLITCVIPAYNEEECIPILARRLQAVSAELSDRFDFEFIIVENGSGDSTFERLVEINRSDSRFKVIRFSRNFGIEGALTAGLRHARGEAAIIMCADLQDPPELIPAFIAAWEEGYVNVFGVVEKRRGESWFRRKLTRGFYWLLARSVTYPVPENASDFRLVDRKLYVEFNRLSEKNRLMRAMWSWFGYRSKGIPHERPARYAGKSTFHFLGNVVFGLHGIAASSAHPLKLVPFAGVGASILAFALSIAIVSWHIVKRSALTEFEWLFFLGLIFLVGLFLMLGIVSEYVGMIFEEVRNRPYYVIDHAYSLDVDTSVTSIGQPDNAH